MKNDMTQGNIKKSLIAFSIPLVISNILQSLYGAVDMFFAGKFLGTAAVSAISVSTPIVNLLLGAITGISLGVAVMIGTYTGHADENQLRKGVGTAISVYALCTVIITFLGYFCTPLFLKWTNTPNDAFNDAVTYMRLIFCGIIFTLGYNLVCAIQRGRGDSNSSMLCVIVATIVNIALDYVFFKYFQMGVKGAAIATIIAQGVSFIIGLYMLMKGRNSIKLFIKDMKINKQAFVLLFKTGIPGMIHQLSINFSNVLVSGMVNSAGLVASAAYGIGLKVNNFEILPSSAVCDAESCAVSQNIGANNVPRALETIKHSRVICLIINVVASVAIFIFAPALSGIMDSNIDVVRQASLFLRVLILRNIAESFVHPLMGFFRGSGNSLIVLCTSLAVQYLLKAPLTYLFIRILGFQTEGVGIAMTVATIATALIYTVYYKKGKWINNINTL